MQPDRQRENQLPLEAYDDYNYLCKDPKDWITKLATISSNFAGIDAYILYYNDKGQGA